MKKLTVIAFAVGFLFLIGTNKPLLAQSTQDVTFQADLLAWYDINISQTTITFTDQVPPVQPNPGTATLTGNPNPVNVRVFAIVLPSSSLQLTVRANGDLTKGVGSDIPISAISWTVTGSGYQAGTMSTSTDITSGQWTGSILHWHAGTFTYLFARDYANQEPGNYTATATYTLSSI